MSPKSVIGVWASAGRKRALIREPGGDVQEAGDWVQVSRLANPLFNEVIVPMGLKDLWNSLPPAADGQFLQHVQHPELAQLLPVLYPGVFPNLANLTARAGGPGGDSAHRHPIRGSCRGSRISPATRSPTSCG